MANLEYKLNVAQAGNAAFMQFLSRLQLDERTYSQMKEEIGQTLRENVLLRFADEVDPAGVPWKKSQRAALQGGQTLSDTTRLKTSISYAVSGDTIEVGTNVEYAEALQFGATIRPLNGNYLKVRGAYGWFSSKEITLPAREFLGISEEDEADVLDVISSFISELA